MGHATGKKSTGKGVVDAGPIEGVGVEPTGHTNHQQQRGNQYLHFLFGSDRLQGPWPTETFPLQPLLLGLKISLERVITTVANGVVATSFIKEEL